MIDNRPILAIILYKADSSTYQRIETAIADGYKLYIFDNYPDDKSKSFIKKWSDNIRYFTFDKNVGIASALKLMCATAYHENYRSLLYFDQDTIFNKQTLKYIYDFVNETSNPLNAILREKILSVTFRDRKIHRGEKQFETISMGKYELNIVDFTISSGTLFDLENLKKTGWHNESYFIDGVDYYICLCAEAAGLRVAEIFNTPGLDHDKEQGDLNFTFLFKQYKGRKYPIYRIKDYITSSLKLIIKSTMMGSKKTLIILKLLLVYIMIQCYFYISKRK